MKQGKFLTVFLVALCLFFSAGVQPEIHSNVESAMDSKMNETISNAAKNVRAIADEYLAAYFDRHPEEATFHNVPDAKHDQFGDRSLEALADWQKKEDNWLLRVDSINPEDLMGTTDYITHSQLKETLEANIGERVCRNELWDVGPLNGWQAELSALADVQPVGDNDLRKQALVRWENLPKLIDQEIQNLKEGIRLGYTASKPVVERVVDQLNLILALSSEQSPFFVPADRDQNPVFQAHFKSLVEYKINPAIQQYRDFLKKDYWPVARENVGISALPNGESCYRAKIRSHTSLVLPVGTIFDMGMQELQDIEKRLALISERSFNNVPATELLKQMKADRSRYFVSEEEILKYNGAALERVQSLIPQWFNLHPKASVLVKPYPEYRAKTGAPGEYHHPSDDGLRPGIFLVNTHQPETHSKVDSESTLFHETIPGHHFQIALAQEQQHLHPINRYLHTDSFAEGWALYSERLADEMGVYSSDFDRVGQLSNEALRAVRMVVDPGLHILGWTREQAIAFILDHTALHENIAIAEVDRYISQPGQATAYTLGAMTIRRLRSQAESALGSRFDIRQFHDEILKDGGVNLNLLQHKVTRWLQSAA